MTIQHLPSHLSEIFQRPVVAVRLVTPAFDPSQLDASRKSIPVPAFVPTAGTTTISTTATAAAVTCVLLVPILYWLYTTNMTRGFVNTVSPNNTANSCRANPKPKTQWQQDRAHVGEAPLYGSKSAASPVSSTIAISSYSALNLSRMFVGSRRDRRLMGLLVVARRVGATTEVRACPELVPISRSKALTKS